MLPQAALVYTFELRVIRPLRRHEQPRNATPGGAVPCVAQVCTQEPLSDFNAAGTIMHGAQEPHFSHGHYEHYRFFRLRVFSRKATDGGGPPKE